MSSIHDLFSNSIRLAYSLVHVDIRIAGGFFLGSPKWSAPRTPRRKYPRANSNACWVQGRTARGTWIRDVTHFVFASRDRELRPHQNYVRGKNPRPRPVRRQPWLAAARRRPSPRGRPRRSVATESGRVGPSAVHSTHNKYIWSYSSECIV